jgi:hypothetical protein
MKCVVVFTAAGLVMSAGAFGDITPISDAAPRLGYDVDRMWGFRDPGRSLTWPESWDAGGVGLIEHHRVSRLVLAVHEGFSVAHGDGVFDEVLDAGLSPTFVFVPEALTDETNLTLVPAPLSLMLGLAGLGGVGVLGMARGRSRRMTGLEY